MSWPPNRWRLSKNEAALAKDPALREIIDHYRAIRKVGARLLYQGVWIDGVHKNSCVYSTTAMATDEAGYLKALEGCGRCSTLADSTI
jgi:hypothetical protein